jgi:hypothetical protein
MMLTPKKPMVPIVLRSTMYSVFEKKSYIVTLDIYVGDKERLDHVTIIIVIVGLYVQLKLEQIVSIY